MTAAFPCRICARPVGTTFVDLGEMPLANAYLDTADLDGVELWYPLHPRVCDNCLLVQVESVVSPEALFSDYAYFSSYSESWVDHARRFTQAAALEFALGPTSLVIEVASNDGYLLRHFVEAGVPVLGIEPAANIAEIARAAGVPTETRFFGRDAATDLVERGMQADLLVANNVLAHVPDLDDFVAGMAGVLKPGGVVSIEVPHLLHLMAEVQFDTIYHEHLSYFSLLTGERALRRHGLAVFDVEQLPTHGGSLRIWADRRAGRPKSSRLHALRALEREAGLNHLNTYSGFGERVERCVAGANGFFAECRASGRAVVAYGAAAKGNTLLNACRATRRDIQYVVDRSLKKQGRFLPGTRLPIYPPDRIFETQPDYVVILPWNLRQEISSQMAGIGEWGGRFVTLVPDVRVM